MGVLAVRLSVSFSLVSIKAWVIICTRSNSIAICLFLQNLAVAKLYISLFTTILGINHTPRQQSPPSIRSRSTTRAIQHSTPETFLNTIAKYTQEAIIGSNTTLGSFQHYP
jgi:hypothetical protein